MIETVAKIQAKVKAKIKTQRVDAEDKGSQIVTKELK